MYKHNRSAGIWLILSVVVVSMMILFVQCADTEDPAPQPGDDDPNIVLPESITFNITETYQQKEMSKILVCSEEPHGDHPKPKEACEELKDLILHGEGEEPPICPCPKIYDPVHVNVDIYYEDYAINYPVDFDNTCIFHCETKPLKQFFDIGLVPDNTSK